MEIVKIEKQDLVSHFKAKIDEEFLQRNPNYYDKKTPGIMYPVSPMGVIFEFSNDKESQQQIGRYYFELESHSDIEFLDKNLAHRAKLNYSDNVQDQTDKVYGVMWFI